MSSSKKTQKKKIKENHSAWYVAGAVLLLMVVILSLFVSTNIYDSQRFAQKATAAITSEPAREAIATEITSEILTGQSLIVKRLLSEPLESLVASTLKTDAFSSVFYEFANSLNRILTSSDFNPVTIDIGSITTTVDSLADAVNPDNELDLSRFESEEIIIFENTDLPPFKTIGQTLLIVGPLSLLAIVVGTLVAFRKVDDKRGLLKYGGLVLMITGSALLVMTLTSGGLLTISIVDPERSIIMQEIYNSFISNFRIMQTIMIILGGALYGTYYYLANDIVLSIKSRNN